MSLAKQRKNSTHAIRERSAFQWELQSLSPQHTSSSERAFQSSAGVNNTPRLFYIPLSHSLTLAILSCDACSLHLNSHAHTHNLLRSKYNIGLAPIKTDRKPTALWTRENSCIENDWEAQRVKSVKSSAAASFSSLFRLHTFDVDWNTCLFVIGSLSF